MLSVPTVTAATSTYSAITIPTEANKARGRFRSGSRTSSAALAISSNPSYATKMSIPPPMIASGSAHWPVPSRPHRIPENPVATNIARISSLSATTHRSARPTIAALATFSAAIATMTPLSSACSTSGDGEPGSKLTA